VRLLSDNVAKPSFKSSSASEAQQVNVQSSALEGYLGEGGDPRQRCVLCSSLVFVDLMHRPGLCLTSSGT
jgi:hypothetical protein